MKLNEGESCERYIKIDNAIYGCYLDSIIDYYHFHPLVNVKLVHLKYVLSVVMREIRTSFIILYELC